MIRELRKLKKEGGLPFCEACLKRKCLEANPDPSSFQKALDSGLYKGVQGKKCFICEADAVYITDISDAMKAIKAHVRK